MSDISNRTIVALLAVALVVSVAGTMYSVSELGQMSFNFRTISAAAIEDSGNVTLNITKIAALEVFSPNPGIDGHVAFNSSHCRLGLGAPIGDNTLLGGMNANEGVGSLPAGAGCEGNFTNSTKRHLNFHLIENTGNVDLNISATPYDVSGGHTSVCGWITGIDDRDGTNGCDDGTQSTRSDVDVDFNIDAKQVNSFSSAANRREYDLEVTTSDQNDTQHVLTAAEVSKVGFKTNLDTSPSTLYNNSNQLVNGNNGLPFEDYRDELAVGFNFIVPQDALPGVRELEIMYVGKHN